MDAEVIVVGGGVVGLWTGYALASDGVKTIILEQFTVGTERGSSYGRSRLTRSCYPEPEYSVLMPEANRRWKELEAASGIEFLLDMGLLTVYDMATEGKEFKSMLSNIRVYGSVHEVYQENEISERFAGLSVGVNDKGIFDGKAGMLASDKCIDALKKMFLYEGGILREHESVVSLKPISDAEVEVNTVDKTYRCASVVLACGTYINTILKTINLQLPVQVVPRRSYYLRDKTPSMYSLEKNFPATIFHENDDHYCCVMPSHEYPGLIKVLVFEKETTKTARNGKDHTGNGLIKTNKKEEERLLEYLKCKIGRHYPGVDASKPAVTEDGMITKSPDDRFILDYHPSYRNVVIGTGFSGHGFKTAPTIGHILADMALGLDPPYAMDPFSLDRFKSPSRPFTYCGP